MIDDIKYLKATAKDEDAAAKLHALLNEDDDTKTAEEVAAEIHAALKNKILWVAKIKNQVIGYIMCKLFDEKHKYFPNSIFIDGLYVLEKFRGKGIGKKLIEVALKNKYPKQYTYFSLTHDPASAYLTKFYNSCGFVENGVTGAGNIMMIKKFPSTRG